MQGAEAIVYFCVLSAGEGRTNAIGGLSNSLDVFPRNSSCSQDANAKLLFGFWHAHLNVQRLGVCMQYSFDMDGS